MCGVFDQGGLAGAEHDVVVEFGAHGGRVRVGQVHQRRAAPGGANKRVVEELDVQGEVGCAGVVVHRHDLRRVRLRAALYDHVPAQGHVLRGRCGTAVVVVGHQVALIRLGTREPVVFDHGIVGANVKILPLDGIVRVRVAKGEGASVNVDVVRGRAGRGVQVAVPVELAVLDGDLAVLTAAGETVVVVAEDHVAQLDALGRLVVADPRRVEASSVAAGDDDVGNLDVLGTAELPAPTAAIARGVTAGSGLDGGPVEVPDRRVRRILGVNDDRLSGRRLGLQVDTELVRAWIDEHLIAGLGRFDLGERICGSDFDGGAARRARERRKHARQDQPIRML